MKKIAQILIKYLSRLAYESITVDSLNQKLTEAVPGLLIDGKQAYQFANPADMPEGRFVNFLNFRQELYGGLEREQNIKLFEEIAEANNKGDGSKIGAITLMAIDVLTNCTPVESYYNMASLIYFTKDEDLKTWDADYNLKKITGFKDQKNKDFFFAKPFEPFEGVWHYITREHRRLFAKKRTKDESSQFAYFRNDRAKAYKQRNKTIASLCDNDDAKILLAQTYTTEYYYEWASAKMQRLEKNRDLNTRNGG